MVKDNILLQHDDLKDRVKTLDKYDEEYLRCKNVWDKLDLTWSKRYKNEINLHRFVKSKLPAHCHILDVGCCDGVFDYTLAFQGFVVTAIDASNKAIEVAKKQKTKLAQGKTSPLFIHKRFEDFNSDPVFHYVTMLEFLEHQDNFDIASFLLRKAYNLCTNGVIISVPIDHLITSDDHKIYFSAELFFNLVYKSTFQTNEPPPIIEYYMINKSYQDRHNQTFTPSIFVAILKKQWVNNKLDY